MVLVYFVMFTRVSCCCEYLALTRQSTKCHILHPPPPPSSIQAKIFCTKFYPFLFLSFSAHPLPELISQRSQAALGPRGDPAGSACSVHVATLPEVLPRPTWRPCRKCLLGPSGHSTGSACAAHVATLPEVLAPSTWPPNRNCLLGQHGNPAGSACSAHVATQPEVHGRLGHSPEVGWSVEFFFDQTEQGN